MNPDAKTETATSSHDATTDTVPQPPVARREPVEHALHGDRRVDHYAWLRQKENPDVIAYLEAENAYTDAILRPTEQLQEKLYQEMLGRIQQTDFTVPYRLRGYLYFTRTEEGKQYSIHCRRREVESASEERSEEHTSELQSQSNLVCRLLLEKKKKKQTYNDN